MVKKKTHGKSKPGTWVERDVYMSRAFLELSGFGPQLLVLLLGKRRIDRETNECTNRDKITMTYAELENIHNRGMSNGMKRLIGIGEENRTKDGVSRPRISRAFDELLAKGFIQIIFHGGAYKHDKSVYGFTDEWRYWKLGQVVRIREKETRTKGFLNKYKKPIVANVSVPIHTDVSVPIHAQERPS